jgi:hypothetical protein
MMAESAKRQAVALIATTSSVRTGIVFDFQPDGKVASANKRRTSEA